MELQAISGYYRRHFLQFGNGGQSLDAADLSLDGTMASLAWVIRHFVPLVVEQPKVFWESLLAGRPLNVYMTTSDLAFTILVLEHNMVQWHRLVLFQLETGGPPTAEYIQDVGGLLYKDGIAGREAKQRYDDLNVYFYRNFCTPACPKNERNLGRLQNQIAELVKVDSEAIKKRVKNCGPPTAPIKPIQDDILHRVFTYVYNT